MAVDYSLEAYTQPTYSTATQLLSNTFSFLV